MRINQWMIAMFLIAYNLSLRSSSVHALIAYDCDDEATELTTVSLRDVMDCPNPGQTYQTKTIQVNVIQKNDIRLIKVKTCLIEITRMMFYCGMHSHSSLVDGGLSSYIHRVGAEECSSIHRYGTFEIYGRTIGAILPNTTTTASITLLGQVDGTGKCQGTTYQEKGQSWKDVVITASIRVHISDYLAAVQLDDNTVSLNDKLSCPFLENYCFDAKTGETVWDSNPTDKCEGQISSLYEGPAETIQSTKDAERILVVEHGGKIFALTLIGKVTLCRVEAWQTEHPRILVLDTPQSFEKAALLPQNTDLTAYINSKFLYVEQAYKKAISQMYVDTVHRRCLMQREILKNRLLLAPLSPNTVSQLVKTHEGYAGRVLGEVLYIMKCVPKVVTVRRTEGCFNELPIKVNNQSKFMAPLTRIIQNVAEQIDCTGITPPLYYIDGEWIGMAPLLTVKQPPIEINVDSTYYLNFTPIMPVGHQGLYTREEASQVQRILTFGVERKAVENLVGRRIAGLETQDQGMSPLKLFNAEEIRSLAHTTARWLWGWFSDIGVFMSGILGFIFIFRLCKYVLGVCINGVQLYRTFGGGLQLLASLWNTLTIWLIHKHHSTNQNQRRVPDPEVPETIPLTDVPSRLYPTPNIWAESERALSQPNLSTIVEMLPQHQSTRGSTANHRYPVSSVPTAPPAPHWTDSMPKNLNEL